MNERAITSRALNQLEFQTGLVGRVGGYAPTSAGHQSGEALIKFDNCDARLVAELREWAAPGSTDKVLKEVSSGYQKLLVCDYVSEEEGARLRESNINYLDSVGNAYLNIPPIYVMIQGKRLKDGFGVDKTAKLFTETGLKVILALLANKGLLNSSYRMIADHANVSMGTIGWVLREMKNQGFTHSQNGRTRWLSRDRLIKRWVDEYPTLKEKYLLGSYYTDDENWWQSIELEKYQAVLGGEIAGVDYVNGFTPTSGEIFVGKHKQGRLVSDLGLIEIDNASGDQQMRIDILAKFWGRTEDVSLFDNLAHPLINYASLMDTWDPKSRDLASKIAERFL